MRVPITVLLLATGAVACSYGSRPPSSPTASAAPAPPTRVETAQVSESAPPEPGIPKNHPDVAPPVNAAVPSPDQTPLTLTPASGIGAPRTASAQLVPSDPTRDKPESVQDQESIREIRELLASDKKLAPIAHQVTIVARHGRVWLRGQVNTADQRAAIEKVARQAAGVINVKNELAVME